MQCCFVRWCSLWILITGQLVTSMAIAQTSEPAPAVTPPPNPESASTPAPSAVEPVPAAEAAASQGEAKPSVTVTTASEESEPATARHRHWDVRLAAGMMPFFGRSEAGLTAQWVRHGRSWLKFGLFARTLAQAVRRQELGGVSRRNFSALGFAAEIDVLGDDAEHPRLTLGMQMGQGWLSRRWQIGESKNFKQNEFYMLEPYLLAHFFHWRRIDWGVGVAYAVVKAKSDATADAEELRGVSGFLSFQHEI